MNGVPSFLDVDHYAGLRQLLVWGQVGQDLGEKQYVKHGRMGLYHKEYIDWDIISISFE